VWRDDACRLLDEPFLCAFVTSPAPMAKGYRTMAGGPDGARDVLREVLGRRVQRVVESVISSGFATAVFGAFGNNPGDVSQIFYDVLVTGRVRFYFERVLFAVWDPYQTNWVAFEEKFREVSREGACGGDDLGG
jgi:uncharacterized protein (TIGR02452 family)